MLGQGEAQRGALDMTLHAGEAITIMHCSCHRRATKLVRELPDGTIDVVGYDCGEHFSFAVPPFAVLWGLAAVLDHIGNAPRAFALRGEPLPGIDAQRCRRLLNGHENGTPATFREVARQWVVVDLDNVFGPYRIDPRDGGLAGIYCRSLLLEPWRRCSLPIDTTTLHAIQPIFVARPILVGVAAAIMYRTGLEEEHPRRDRLAGAFAREPISQIGRPRRTVRHPFPREAPAWLEPSRSSSIDNSSRPSISTCSTVSWPRSAARSRGISFRPIC